MNKAPTVVQLQSHPLQSALRRGTLVFRWARNVICVSRDGGRSCIDCAWYGRLQKRDVSDYDFYGAELVDREVYGIYQTSCAV